MDFVRSLQPDQSVRHQRYGVGSVLLDHGPTAIVRFSHGIEECLKHDLEPLEGLAQKIARESWDSPLEVMNRTQAEAITSINDMWGVFSRSRVALLPHQLWVCHLVNAQWPARWLVADDVGLGKTIEAGMILWPLIARGTVRRLLILCPASLVSQWQYRLRTMFDIRLVVYSTEADTSRSDFWGTNNQVVASIDTLKMDRKGRRERLLAADPWDMVIVDESHHLNASEETGYTLGYRLVRDLQDAHRIRSMVFFTGTPHRGKDYGFFAQLQLLRPDLFDPKKPPVSQIPQLRRVMIRNNKSTVTDLLGNRLFHPPNVMSETYAYSLEEQMFYDLLTRFIVTGQAYASNLSKVEGRAVMLVLIAMQKLASSSVAAIRRAVRGRLERLQAHRQRVSDLEQLLSMYQEMEQYGEGDRVAEMEEEISTIAATLRLMENEEPILQALLDAAEAVGTETKVTRLLELIAERFPGRSLLLFTEYKATQSLIMSALIQHYGRECVTFINGDARAEEVRLDDGRCVVLHEARERAVEKFSSGSVRFLVSTEAGGEGIDLQARCHTLIHVDLPWNPMRMHQRVGRLNRYGQTQQVDVLTLRNPETVESLIWEKLNEKISRISLALGQVMDEPEDMLQFVLGMTSPALFREVFSGAQAVPREALDTWFDQKTATFGGSDVIKTVQNLVGNASRFDFRDVSDRLPRVDLPDLYPFIESSLILNNRRLRDEGGRISFLTPDAWRNDPAIAGEYRGMHFQRLDTNPEASGTLLGVGHRVLTQALKQAISRDSAVTTLPRDVLPKALFCFRLTDRVTGEEGKPRSILAAVEISSDGSERSLLLDWQLLKKLNALPYRRLEFSRKAPPPSMESWFPTVHAQAEAYFTLALEHIEHPFRAPRWEVISVFWPRGNGNSTQ